MDTWPDIDNGVTCNDCTALINIEKYKTCRAYCGTLNLECRNAYEEKKDSCAIKDKYNCDTDFNWTSDALCQCKNAPSRRGSYTLDNEKTYYDFSLTTFFYLIV